jgi:sigma-B regulation protein RsbU (phosphoserine phosphatase)
MVLTSLLTLACRLPVTWVSALRLFSRLGLGSVRSWGNSAFHDLEGPMLLGVSFSPVPTYIHWVSGILGGAVLAVLVLRTIRTSGAVLAARRCQSVVWTPELVKARRIQQNLLPGEVHGINGACVGARSEAAMGVGGDYYDVIPLDDDRFAIIVGDVAGKGLPAALLMSNLQAGVRLLVPVHRRSLGRLMSELNLLMCSNSTADMFASLFVAIVDTRGGRVRYVNAGHERPLLLRGDRVHELREAGLVLGVLPEASYVPSELPMTTHDLLAVYSDGLAEALGEGQSGRDRLVGLLRYRHSEAPARIVDAVFATAAPSGGRPHDDQTLVVVRRTLS